MLEKEGWMTMEGIYGLKKQVLPIALSVAMINWTSRSMFGLFDIGILLMAFVFTCMIFVAYNFAQKHGRIKVLLFLAFSFLYLIVCQIVLTLGNRNLIVFLIAVYGYASTVYYFTIIRYRVAVVFLIGLIPFLIHTSRTAKGITIHFTVFIILFFLLYYERTIKKKVGTGNRNTGNNKWYYMSMIVFLAIVLVGSLAAPKPTVIPRLAYVNAVIEQVVEPLGGAAAAQQNLFQGINNNLFNPISLKTQSQLDSLSAPLSDRILFEVDAEEPLYMRIQSWDKYENNVWKVGNKELLEYKLVENYYNDGVKFVVFAELIKRAREEGIVLSTLPEASEIWNYASTPQAKRKATIINVNNFSTQLIPVPVGTVAAYSEDDNSGSVFMNKSGSCNTGGSGSLRPWKSYNLEYMAQRIGKNSFEHKLIEALNEETAESLLDMGVYQRDNGESLEISYDNLNVLYGSYEDLKSAYESYTQLPPDISDRIYNLAQRITEGKDSHFEKALAIEQYFHNSDYVYDLDPPRIPGGAEAVDYFVFESRKGFCIHYASAMVLLARACGLPARYSEGYVVDEFDSSIGRFVVRDKNAHAFPEIYIPAYGWMAFEPTVSVMEKDALSIFFDKMQSALIAFGETVTNLIGVIPIWVRVLFIPFFLFALLFLGGLIRIAYIHLWKKKMLRIDGNKAVDRIFFRIIKLLGVVNLNRDMHETPLQYGKRIFEESGIAISDFVEVFNKSKYARIKPSSGDVRLGIALYRDVVIYVKGRLKWFNLMKYFWFV